MPHRVERVNSLIRQEISELLQREIKDPRLSSLISITEVSTSPDLKFAKVFVSRLGGEEEKKETLEALVSACGYIRRELAKRMNMRSVPELSFHWDDSIERGDRLLRLMDEVSSDKTGQESPPA